MTITYNSLKSNHSILSDDKIIETLIKYDNSFFSGWINYNSLIFPNKAIGDYIIDLPATMIDEINQLLSLEATLINP